MPTARKTDPAADGPATIPVAEGEEPWTAEELAEVREELNDEIVRLERTIAVAEAGLQDLFADGSEGAGRDAADVGLTNFERDQELSLAQNARDMFDQAQLALRLFDSGNYGSCESCGRPIGKDRLQVFPRATLCMGCKKREERR
ncbi:MAG: TraR/DksA C4-type zinc finger protein [Micropruina sp.]